MIVTERTLPHVSFCKRMLNGRYIILHDRNGYFKGIDFQAFITEILNRLAVKTLETGRIALGCGAGTESIDIINGTRHG